MVEICISDFPEGLEEQGSEILDGSLVRSQMELKMTVIRSQLSRRSMFDIAKWCLSLGDVVGRMFAREMASRESNAGISRG